MQQQAQAPAKGQYLDAGGEEPMVSMPEAPGMKTGLSSDGCMDAGGLHLSSSGG